MKAISQQQKLLQIIKRLIEINKIQSSFIKYFKEFRMIKEFDEFSMFGAVSSQMDIYSPTPKIKIKKWYVKVCSACIYSSRDFGEYDNVGWAYCATNQKLGNMKCFPKCNAKSCKEFEAISLLMDAGWSYMMDFEKVFSKNQYMKRLMNYMKFNERMGDYKVGRIS